jgi:membrane-associated protein
VSEAGFLETLVEWIGPVFVVAGYWIVFGSTLVERSIFIGLVMPGDVVLAMAGIYAARGALEIGWVIVLGAIGAVLGESLGYWLGRRYGVTLIRRLPFVNRMERKLADAELYFAHHGGKTVAIGRFATAAGAVIPFTAGLARMSYARFLAFDVPSVIVWAAGISLVGYLFGANLERVDTIMSRFGWIMLGVLVLLIGTIWLTRRRRSRRAAAEDG